MSRVSETNTVDSTELPKQGGEGVAMSLAGLAGALDGTVYGDDRTFQGVTTDSRRVDRGALFVALRGPRFDAHRFLGQVAAAGAAGALVERRMPLDLPQVEVEDSRVALGGMAAHWRAGFDLPVIGVTGSNGKTTVKEMLGGIMGRQGYTLVTHGNLNNDIGLPLTLLRLSEHHRYAVIEMGANHPGEIAGLGALARPTVALVTNAGPAHLEGFGSVAGVARAKGEVYGSLGDDGIAIVNEDDPYAPLWRELADRRRVWGFGLDRKAEVSARDVSDDGHGTTRFLLVTPAGEVPVRLRLEGRHNLRNALAASAAALAAGAGLKVIRAGLESMQPVPGRLLRQAGPGGVSVIDDTYNANPASIAAALEVLAASKGRRVLVLGDMAEMGSDAATWHADIGREARRLGIDALYATGELSRVAVERFRGAGGHYADLPALVTALRQELSAEGQADTTVLVKGSRRAGMERAVEEILNSKF